MFKDMCRHEITRGFLADNLMNLENYRKPLDEVQPEGTGYLGENEICQVLQPPGTDVHVQGGCEDKTSGPAHLPVPEAKFETVVAKPSRFKRKWCRNWANVSRRNPPGAVDASRGQYAKREIKNWTLADIKKLKLKDKDGKVTNYKQLHFRNSFVNSKRKNHGKDWTKHMTFLTMYMLYWKTETQNQVIMKGGQPIETVKREFGSYLDKVLYMPVII